MQARTEPKTPKSILNSHTQISRYTKYSNLNRSTSSKFAYSIQSLPHQIQHRKYAFNDYFVREFDQEIQLEQQHTININQSVTHHSKQTTQNNQKNQKLQTILKKFTDKQNKILRHSFLTLKQQNPQKPPPKKHTSMIKKYNIKYYSKTQATQSQQQDFQLNDHFIVGTSKQNNSYLDYSKKNKKKQQPLQIVNFMPNVIPVNKLVLVQDITLVQRYGQYWNNNKFNYEYKAPNKTFSILNEQKKQKVIQSQI